MVVARVAWFGGKGWGMGDEGLEKMIFWSVLLGAGVELDRWGWGATR